MNEVLAIVQELATILTPTADAIDQVLALLKEKNATIAVLQATEAKENEQEKETAESLKSFAEALKAAQASLTSAIAANSETSAPVEEAPVEPSTEPAA